MTATHATPTDPTVGELIAALEHYDPAALVRLAINPAYSFEYLLAQVLFTHDGTDPPVVWLGAGDQVGYLPTPAADALGWS